MAERALTASVISAITSGTIRPFLLAEIEYVSAGVSGFLRLFTGVGQLSWNGFTWTGGRDLLAIAPVRESVSLESIGFSITISGLPSDKLSLALANMQKNRSGKIWLGFLDSAGAVIADPYLTRRGRFSCIPISREGDTMTVQAQYEGPLARLLTANERRYTHEDQQLRWPGDKGFDQVAELIDAQDLWGSPVPAPVTGTRARGSSRG